MGAEVSEDAVGGDGEIIKIKINFDLVYYRTAKIYQFSPKGCGSSITSY